MKQLSIIMLTALALALLPAPAAQAQGCNAYTQADGAGLLLILEGTNILNGCEAFLGHSNLAYLGATLEVFQRPGITSIHGNINFKTAKDQVVDKRLIAPPTASDSDAALLKSGTNIRLQLAIPDGGTFSARLTIRLGNLTPTPTPVPTPGACGAGDFYCDYSGRGYSQTLTGLRIGGSSAGGSQTEDYVVSSHLAEPGAWRVKAWGCGSMSGSNRGLFLTIRAQADGLADTDLINSIPLGSEELATTGFIYHVPIPANRELGDTDRRLVLRLNTGSGWPADEFEECNFSFTKLENNNYNASSGTLTIYQGRQAWGGIPKYYIFPSAASAATVNISWSFDADWITTLPHGSPTTFCRSEPGAQTTLNAGNPVRTLALTAGAEFFCGGTNENRQAKIVITISSYVAGPTNTATASRTATITPTPSTTRTLAPAYTRTPTQPTNTRTNTLTPSASNTSTATVTGTRPVEAPCALSVTHNIPVAPGTATIKLSLGIQFVVADNPVFVNMSTAVEIVPGTYTWSEQTADYTFYSLTGPARVLVCTATAATATMTASRTITPIGTGTTDEYCFPATAVPIDDVNPALPDLGLIMPSWTPTVMISITTTAMTTTIAISVTAVIGLISTVETGIISPAARIQTAVAPYSWESGETTGASWAARLDPVLQWLAILNPDNPAWATAGGPLWALSPVLIYLLPIVIVLLAVALLLFVLWLAQLLLAALQLIMQVIETITP